MVERIVQRGPAALVKATVTIANTGPVIPPEQVHRLFEPSSDSTARADDHHGLGLSHRPRRHAYRERAAAGWPRDVDTGSMPSVLVTAASLDRA
jgi:hypothetical protein